MIDPRRSLPVDMLALLLDVPGIRWFSLQVGDRANDLQLLSPDCIVDLSVNLTGFAETAAAMANLDLIVSVDTAAAHLAGALGKPVWLLNRFDADWRWLLDREDSPWYPSMRIFRQSRLGDWGSVIAHVTGELARFVEKSS